MAHAPAVSGTRRPTRARSSSSSIGSPKVAPFSYPEAIKDGNINEFLEKMAACLKSDTESGRAPEEVLRGYRDFYREQATALQPNAYTTARLTTAIAAVKGAMGAASLIELLAVAMGCNLNSPGVAPWVLSSETLVGLFLALPLSLPFYLANVHEGLVSLGMADPMTPEEEELRKKFEEMSWAKWGSIVFLAAGFAVTQAGMVGSTFYLDAFAKLINVPPYMVQLTIGLPLGCANFVIGAPKAAHMMEVLSSSKKPTFASACNTVTALLLALSGVIPNILGAGGLLVGENRLPFIPDTGLGDGSNVGLQFAIGLIASFAPIGLNEEELDKLWTEREKFHAKLRHKLNGFASAAVSAAFTCIFTYAQMIKTFDPTASRTAAIPKTDKPVLQSHGCNIYCH
jgi:hypothetical protein